MLPKWWRAHFLGAELVLSVVLAGAVIIWSERYGGWASVHSFLTGARSGMYAALASIYGSLFGFVIATVAVVLGFSTSDRLKPLRDSRQYLTLWRVFKSAIWTLAFATVAAVAALVLDRDASPMRLAFYLVFGTSILVAARLGRCIWVLENMIDIVTAPSPAQKTKAD